MKKLLALILVLMMALPCVMAETVDTYTGASLTKSFVAEEEMAALAATLTTMGALEFGKRYAEDKESAWKDYLTLCDLGGSMSYLNLLRAANVSVPFEEGAVDRSTSLARETLKQALKKEGLWD